MKNSLPFFAALIVAFSMCAQDCGNCTMLNVAQAKIGNGSSASVRQVVGNDRLAIFENERGGFAIVKNDGKSQRVVAYSQTSRLDLSHESCGFSWWLNAINNTRSLFSTTIPDTTRFPKSVEPLITTS